MEDKYLIIYGEIGKNLKRERRKAGLTQLELANKTNKIDRSKISEIENGKVDFMFSTLLELAIALKIDIEKLIKRERNSD